MTDEIARAAEYVAEADRIFAFVGAGFSAESGVPTFRGEDGIFSDEKIAELAYVETFEREPERALKWLQEARSMMAAVEPNEGHRALARLAARDDKTVTVATQNIDGLVERAARRAGVGVGRDLAVHHIHGSMTRIVCHDCGRAVDASFDASFDASDGGDDALDLSEMPTCEHCGGLLRPDVVLFGEMLPQEAFQASVQAARSADVGLLLGTSGIVYPAADLPRQASRAGASLVEINPNPTDLSSLCDVVIRAKTGEALPQVVDGA